jgi:hypothetical protein
VVDGDEGTGKTHFALMICKHADPTFDEKRVAYCYADVMHILDSIPDDSIGKAVLLDEAAEALFALDYGKRDVKELQKLFFRIRKKRIYFVLCIPSVLDLVKTFRKRRIKTVFHCRYKIDAKGILHQGYFDAYTYQQVQDIIKINDYPRPNFTGSWSKNEVPAELWNAVMAKNYSFLRATHKRKVLELQSKYDVDLKIIQATKELMFEEPTKFVPIYQIEQRIIHNEKYTPNWLNPKLVSRKLHKYGFTRITKDHTRGYILSKEYLDKYEQDIKLEIAEANQESRN